MEFVDVARIIGVIISGLNFVIVIIVAVGGWIAFKKITTNDLTHLDAKVDDLAVTVGKTNETVIALTEHVAYIRGKCDSSTCGIVRKSRRAKTRAKAPIKRVVKNGR